MTIARRARDHDVPDWLVRLAIIAGCALVIGLAAAAVIWLALRVRYISMATVLGFAEVALLWPAVKWMRNRGVPQTLAAILCVLAFFAFFALIVIFVVAQIVEAAPRMANAVTGSFEDLLVWIRSGPFGADDQTVQDILDELQSSLSGLVGTVSGTVVASLGVIANVMTVVLIATFFAIFALSSGDRLWEQFLRTLPEERRLQATASFRAAMRTTGAWFYASTVTGLVDGLFIGVGLVVLDVPLAIPIGALTFVLAYVPLVGATIAGAVAVAAAFITGGLTTALWALAVVLIVQQLEGNVLSPLLMSRAVRFHPVITLLLTTTAAAMFGLVGLFLATPVTGAVVAAVLAYRRCTPVERPPQPAAGAGEKDGGEPGGESALTVSESAPQP